MTDNYDQLALSWVRKEINNTLDQARQGLETFVEDNQDKTQIQFCINCLHQVQGTLQMLGFDGASRLAREMESVAEKISTGDSFEEVTIEVLMRSMMQLPGYLERVEAGQKDAPVVLLPLINELRKASGLAPANENEFFTANTESVAPPKPQDQVSEQDKSTSFQDNCKKLRSHYQKGLAGIIRGKQIKESLARIHKVLIRLEALTEGSSVARLWWVADGFIFAIAENGFYKQKDVHALLGQVDKQIKRLSDLGDSALNDDIPADLLSKLLYFVAYSKSKNKRIVNLKKEFNLDQALTESETIKKQQDQMARPDSAAMENVIGAIEEELASVKDQLDLFVRAQAKEPAQLQSLHDSLIRIADTLSVLELPVPRDVIREQTNNLQKSISGGVMPDDSAIMDIAGALLFVDANLSTYGKDDIDTTEESSENIVKLGEQRSKDSQIDEATIALVGVARKNLQLAKDGMIGYIASSFNQSELESVPKLLKDVLGAMKIIAFDDAAEVLQIAESYVEKRLQAIKRTPDVKYLDALADIITSVDYYLEGREEGNNKTIKSILQSAQPSQDLLLEALNNLDSEGEEDSETAHVESNEQVAAHSNVVPISQSSALKEVDESLIDDEVLEIFLEEAEEEVDALEHTLPTWIGDTSNKDALVTIRRSFHTLKGSGRLVGAVIIGELSWAVENMLNKVLEDSINPDAAVCTLLNNALTKLPNLVKEFAEKQPHQGNDVEELIARANHIAKGLNLTDFEFQSSEPQVETVAEEVSEEVAEPTIEEQTLVEEEPLDPVLLEIFVNEAQVHLAAINEFIENIPRSRRVAVSDALIRALHTLKGSAHMAKVDAIAKITGPFENYTRIMKANGERLEGEAIQLLIDSSEFLASVVENLKDNKPINSDVFVELQQRVSQLVSSQIEQSEEGGQVQLRDQQLISIFLTEGNDILREVSSLLKQLKDNPQDESACEKMTNELHAFRRGSEMIGIQTIENLAANCEAICLMEISDQENKQECLGYLEAGVEALNQMIESLKNETEIKQPLALIEEMQSWMADVSKTDAPKDMDQELVELFVEEADELTESARDLLARWKDNLQNADIINELRRVYHTFKGSSRMAGAMHIGDLAFSIEELFNTRLNFDREISEKDLQLSSMATNKLAEMVDELRGYRWPKAATAEIAELTERLNPDAVKQEAVETTSIEQAQDDKITGLPSDESEKSSAEEDVFELDETLIEMETLEDPAGPEVLEDALTIDESLDFDIQQETLESQQQNQSLQSDKIEGDSTPKESIETENLQDMATDGDISVDEISEPPSATSDKDEPQEVEPELKAEDPIEEAEVVDNIEKIIEQSKSKETGSEAVVTEDTIVPAEPLVVSGNVYTLDLDEDGLEVLEIYLKEADELLITLDEALNQWSEDQADSAAIDTILRVLHTFKGGARLADLVVLGDLTHEIESYFEKINAGSLTVEKSHVTHILQGYDVIEALIKEVNEKNQMTMPEDYFDKLKKIIAGESIDDTKKSSKASKAKTGKKAKAKETKKGKKKEKTADIVPIQNRRKTDDQAKAPSTVIDSVRVNSNQLENLVNLAGETSIFRSRLEQQMSVLRYNLEEMSSTVERLKDQLRNLDIETEAQISYRREISGGTEYEDFDPLEMDRYTRQQELTRGLGESAVDLMNLKETLDSLTSDSETLLLQQGRVNTEMQESLMKTRMTPFESLVPRLRRMVRQISTELGKTIELSISAEGEMDRSVLERMNAPLEHMLRNAMDHGIESPKDRKKAKKPETGKIAISLYREGSEVFIKIKDDGRGLDLDAIKKKAIQQGIIGKDTKLSEHELQQLILEAGFSTAEKVTQISGRGVGMDVVNSEIKQLGGVIDIESVKGEGSTFTVRLPFTVSVNHALMVQIGEEVYAIPLSNIEGIVRVSPFELEEYYSNPESKFAYAGIDYSMYYLGQMLSHTSQVNLEGVTQSLPVLLLHGADHPTALQVDDLLGSREIVVKSIGRQLSSVSGLSGATIQGDGRVVLILDMPALIRRVDSQQDEETSFEELPKAQKIPTVMVVDDSITVRKVTTRLLERYDFQVITAKDGVDAVTILADTLPDVMLLDIEMPRMDGFELATIIRHDKRLKQIPIIMITSRTGGKHRERAESIGVNRYMGKPYNEVDLLETINSLLTEKD